MPRVVASRVDRATARNCACPRNEKWDPPTNGIAQRRVTKIPTQDPNAIGVVAQLEKMLADDDNKECTENTTSLRALCAKASEHESEYSYSYSTSEDEEPIAANVTFNEKRIVELRRSLSSKLHGSSGQPVVIGPPGDPLKATPRTLSSAAAESHADNVVTLAGEGEIANFEKKDEMTKAVGMDALPFATSLGASDAQTTDSPTASIDEREEQDAGDEIDWGESDPPRGENLDMDAPLLQGSGCVGFGIKEDQTATFAGERACADVEKGGAMETYSSNMEALAAPTADVFAEATRKKDLKTCNESHGWAAHGGAHGFVKGHGEISGNAVVTVGGAPRNAVEDAVMQPWKRLQRRIAVTPVSAIKPMVPVADMLEDEQIPVLQLAALRTTSQNPRLARLTCDDETPMLSSAQREAFIVQACSGRPRQCHSDTTLGEQTT